jgi:hypothetical protein
MLKMTSYILLGIVCIAKKNTSSYIKSSHSLDVVSFRNSLISLHAIRLCPEGRHAQKRSGSF